jgi:hypothetical protein
MRKRVRVGRRATIYKIALFVLVASGIVSKVSTAPSPSLCSLRSPQVDCLKTSVCWTRRNIVAVNIKRLLEHPTWPPHLQARTPYRRLHDDHDGKREGHLRVVFSDDGDAWVSIPDVPPGEGLRFRTGIGGGRSLRTRAALLILAEAMRLDNEEEAKRAGTRDE